MMRRMMVWAMMGLVGCVAVERGRAVEGRWTGEAEGAEGIEGALTLWVSGDSASVKWGGVEFPGRVVGVTDSAATFWATLPTFGDTSFHLTLMGTGDVKGIILPRRGRMSCFMSPGLRREAVVNPDAGGRGGVIIAGEGLPVVMVTRGAIYYTERADGMVEWSYLPVGPRPCHAIMGVRVVARGGEMMTFESHVGGVLAVIPSHDRRKP